MACEAAVEFEALASEAVSCRDCFDRLPIEASTIDIAQPRWVGPDYWSAAPRVLLLLLNPGSGKGYAEDADRDLRELLRSFRDGGGARHLERIMSHQGRDMPNWGRRRMKRFYVDGLGRHQDAIAFANVAWCATLENKYPAEMLTTCFGRFTLRLIQILSPDAVLLSGGATHRFRSPIQRALPESRIIPMWHYAHRKSRADERHELARVRHELES